MEIFPFCKDKSLLLTDEMKMEVISTIEMLRKAGEPIHKVIQFERPEENCSYLRKERIFINAKGKLTFCHFLSPLENTEICDIRGKTLREIIEINNKVRDEFLKKKKKELKKWKLPRKTASPCSYCLHYFGVDEKW